MKSYRDAIESLEPRQLMAASSVTLVGNDLQNVAASSGGTAKANANDLILTFSGAIKSTVDTSKIRIFAYASDNTSNTGAQIKKTIPIVSSSVSGSTLTLRTGILVRKGAPISISVGAVKDTSNNDITGSAEAKKGVNKARFTLAGRAFKVTDKTLFSSDVLTGGTAATTANTEPSDGSVKAALKAFLDKKVRQKTITQTQEDAAMTRYDSSAVKAICSSPNLRAAILSLTGTVGEPAIAYYFDGKNSTGKAPIALRFDGTEFDPGAKIVASNYNSQGRLRVIFSPNYAGESFVVLSGILAHEVNQDVHDTTTTSRTFLSQDEEVIANYEEACVYAQQLLADSTYASKGTVLTTRANYRLMLAMNSGKNQFPRTGILAAPLFSGTDAAPGFDTTGSDVYGSSGGTTVPSFDEDIRREFRSRNVSDKDPSAIPTQALLIIQNITGETFTSSTKFGDTLIANIDQNQDVIGDTQAGALAKTLKLRIA